MSGRGKLNFKGDKKKKKSKHKVSSVDEVKKRDSTDKHSDEGVTKQLSDSDDELTAAEKKSLRFKSKQARREMKKVVQLSHRERVEQFNEKLGSLTELNDIPRVSAAGNG